MNAKDLRQLAQNPRFITGIYNYCDNWCERCAFTSRCLSYAQTAELEDDPAAHDLDNARFWQGLAESLAVAQTMLAEMAAERGIDLDAPAVAAAYEAQKQREDEAFAHPLTQAAERYARAADDWFNRAGVALEAAFARWRRDDYAEAERLKHAVEVIRRYQFFSVAKLARACVRDPDFAGEQFQQDDAHGSVKVALITMDRSWLAWARLRELLPEQAAEIRPLLAALEGLRRAVKREFPAAREFIRPGHDEASAYVM